MTDAPDLPTALHPDELAGQLRDVILDHVQKMRTPWAQVPAAEQKAYIQTVSDNSVELIDKCLDCIMSVGDVVVLDVTANDIIEKSESIQTKINIPKTGETCKLMSGRAHKPMKLSFAPQREKVRDLGKAPEAEADQPTMFQSDDEVIGRPQAKSAPMLPSPTASKPKAAKKAGNGRRRKVASKPSLQLA